MTQKLLAEEEAGFRADTNTVEQILNSRFLTEKHLQHGKDLVIDFKRLDWVWHEGLWHVMRKFQVKEGHVGIIETLYNVSRSLVLLNL